MQVKLESNHVRSLDRHGNCTAAKLTYLVSGMSGGLNGSDAALREVYAFSTEAVSGAIRFSVDLTEYKGGGVCEI